MKNEYDVIINIELINNRECQATFGILFYIKREIPIIKILQAFTKINPCKCNTLLE